jgi:hypothetical protein
MSTILSNLGDPSWWFNIFFPVAAVALLPRIGRPLVAKARSVFRRIKARRLSRVRRLRRDPLRITYEMQKASVFFVVFVLMGVAALVSLLVSPFKGEQLRFAAALASFPVLWAEFAWLLKDLLVKDILAYRDRLRPLRHPSEKPYDYARTNI